MAVTIQNDMLEVASFLDEPERSRFLAALVVYGIKSVEPSTDEPWFPLFVAFRERLSMSAKKMSAAKELADRRWKKELEKKLQENAHSDAHSDA